MSGKDEYADPHCEQLRQLAEHRHAASAACHRLAAAAKPAADHARDHGMAAQGADSPVPAIATGNVPG